MQRSLVLAALVVSFPAYAGDAKGGAKGTAPTTTQAAPAGHGQMQGGMQTSTIDVGTAYGQLVADRISYFTKRFDEIEKRASKLDKSQQASFKARIKDARAELTALKGAQKRLDKDKAKDGWSMLHDDAEASFATLRSIYGGLLVSMPDDVVVGLLPMQADVSMMRARAAETARPQGGTASAGAAKPADLSMLKSDSPYASHLRARLERIQSRVSSLEGVAPQGSPVASIAASLRDDMNIVVANAGRLSTAQDAAQWSLFHDGIEAKLDAMASDYALAIEMMERGAVIGGAAQMKGDASMQGKGGAKTDGAKTGAPATSTTPPAQAR